MPLPLVQTYSWPLQSTPALSETHKFSNHNQNPFASSSCVILLLPKSLVPGFQFDSQKHSIIPYLGFRVGKMRNQYHRNSNAICASLIDNPILWAGRLCVFYALLKSGLAGSHSNPTLLSPGDGISDDADLGFSKWLDKFLKNPDKEAAERRKLVSKWHPTTKGTLKRNYRVGSKAEGQRVLKAIASLLSQHDHFVDATSHKGCQIRRESAHGESVCCNNVRALFDELPTPHLVVEITPFPAGPLTHKDYAKAEKLERVLRSSPSL